jgi:dUTP pyrophosphatase
MKFEFKKVVEWARTPSKKHLSDAGIDLSLCPDSPSQVSLWIYPGEVKVLRTGICLNTPKYWWWQLSLRSSIGKGGLCLPHGVGIIDQEYIGEIKVPVVNATNDPLVIRYGERFCQIVPYKQEESVWMEEVSELFETARGTGGFGSTGKT